VKEAHEEAGLSAEAARRAVPVGVVSYLMEHPAGLKPDTLFIYDLEVAEDFVPRNTDGEVEHFMLWTLDEVAQRVRETDDFKFNVNLVIIDFLIRHGYLKPDDAEYPELAIGLRRAV
jgi:8-oxo-dGTP pyrophosphatase MutT (NUDIX family)